MDEDDLALDCPQCGEVEDHEVLRAAASGWTVRCLRCKTTRTLPAPAKIRTRPVPVILAEGATSRTITLNVPLDMPVGANHEFEHDGHRVRITAIERPDGSRPATAPGRDVKTLYAVVFDRVVLRYTLNMGEVTKSLEEEVEPEEEIHVGTVREVDGTLLVVKTLKSDQNRTLHRGFLMARSIRRVFADVAPERARPGQKVRSRVRGAGPWGSKSPTSRVKRPGGAAPPRKK